MKKPSNKLSKAALEAQRQADETQRKALQAQENMRVNFAQNLSQDNTAQVVAGGTADALGLDETETQKKRRTSGAGLASTLGLTE